MKYTDPRLIDQIRRFDRFYEKVLRKAVGAAVSEDFSAADVRVLNELGWAIGGGCTGAWIAFRLDLDTGYLCRVLKKLEAWRLIAPRASLADGRMRTWELTALGRQFADSIESAYRDRVLRVLFDVLPSDQVRLVEAMHVIEEIFASTPQRDLLEIISSSPNT